MVIVAQGALFVLTAGLVGGSVWWLRGQIAATERRLTDRLAAPQEPPPNNDDVLSALSALQRTDLGGVRAKIEAIEDRLDRLVPYDPEPVAALAERVDAMKPADLSPVLAATERLAVALSRVEDRLADVERRLQVPLLETPAPALVAASTQPPRPRSIISRPPADLPSADFDFDASLLATPAPPARAPRPERRPTPTKPPAETLRYPERNLLLLPAFGAPDDLACIDGVGELVEPLERAGVYYFWQIAAWQGDDVAFVASTLGVPEQIIREGDWVDQARALLSQATPLPPDPVTHGP